MILDCEVKNCPYMQRFSGHRGRRGRKGHRNTRQSHTQRQEGQAKIDITTS